MFTVVTEFADGVGKVGHSLAKDADACAAKARANPKCLKVTILGPGVTLDKPALRRAAKALARAYGPTSTTRLTGGASAGYALQRTLGAWSLWGFSDEAEVANRGKLLHDRYLRFCWYCREVLPDWREVERAHYASGGIDSIQVAKDGRRRTVVVQPDRLD